MEKTVEERMAELNKKCMECIQKNGHPNYTRCEYYCQVGKEIHRLDFEKKNGWQSHDYWQKSR